MKKKDDEIKHTNTERDQQSLHDKINFYPYWRQCGSPEILC